ncbi:hypothetical protein [Halorhodospira halochloris]|uniref:hypothetical protein n=1 Tax=Halorhodospira halochloris TaxID=1052 RepID=UPI000BBA5024|nr:hypothetical protein [Halorhodospira halochloris]
MTPNNILQPTAQLLRGFPAAEHKRWAAVARQHCTGPISGCELRPDGRGNTSDRLNGTGIG